MGIAAGEADGGEDSDGDGAELDCEEYAGEMAAEADPDGRLDRSALR